MRKNGKPAKRVPVGEPAPKKPKKKSYPCTFCGHSHRTLEHWEACRRLQEQYRAHARGGMYQHEGDKDAVHTERRRVHEAQRRDQGVDGRIGPSEGRTGIREVTDMASPGDGE